MVDYVYSDFRASGVLSDFSVIVDDKKYKLHKFPLYTRSEYIRDAVTRQEDTIDLPNFPGGAEIFSMVADFCYNVDVHLTTDICIPLRCAAEYLKMSRSGNLCDVTDRFIQDALTMARLNEDLDTITQLLVTCAQYGVLSEEAGIPQTCVDACVDVWLKLRHEADGYLTENPLSSMYQSFSSLPLKYIVKLLKTSIDRDVQRCFITNLVQNYLSQNVREFKIHKLKHESDKKEDEDIDEDMLCTDADKEENTLANQENQDLLSDENKPAQISHSESEPPHILLKNVIDGVLSELPDDQTMFSSVSPEWLTEMIEITNQLGCKNRSVLLRAAATILHKLNGDDLAGIPVSTLLEAFDDKMNDPISQCLIIDKYLLAVAKQRKLDLKTFVKLVEAVPLDGRESCNVLLEVIETVLGQIEQGQKDDCNKKEWIGALSHLDNSKIDEQTLIRSFELNIIPAAFITRSSLALNRRLRTELNDAKRVIQLQESDIRQRTHTVPWTYAGSRFSPRDDQRSRTPGWKLGHRRLSKPLTSPKTGTTTAADFYGERCDDDVELKLALWRLDDTLRK